MKISFIIPALNEENAIESVIKEIPLAQLREKGYEAEILVIDNASTDNTAEKAKAAGAKVVFEPKRGYGNALLKGFDEAKGDIIIMADGDGTYPIRDAVKFIEKIIGGADIVNGSRFNGGMEKGAMPWLHRYIGNPFLTCLLNIIFRTNVSDAHCGMRAIKKEALDKLNLKTPGMEFASEMIIEAARKDLLIAEIPISYRPRKGSRAKLSSLRDGYRHMRFMVLYEPAYIFLVPGIILFLAGLFSLFLLGDRLHSMILGSFLTILGFQVMAHAIYSKIYAVTYRRIRADAVTKIFFRRHTLEYGLILGTIVFFIGVAVGLEVLLKWATTGYGALDELNNAIISITIAITGIQILFSSFYLSVLLLDRAER